ncbi:hypothetical protein HELRODRAFT_183923 [Helobdella robusta]|uniref:Uncharacterized protein n=1 Tax=Helobdella robusta TaxID=6412 RepID=T1FKA9_HELRO|nr:hypothetical protein HELRODRAFT_183923 [Helobdella robusta]ESO09706.1 hypothetical protein HELRODRAFT_183923 [Helobdella robusta]
MDVLARKSTKNLIAIKRPSATLAQNFAPSVKFFAFPAKNLNVLKILALTSQTKDSDQLKAAIEGYQEILRHKANPKNLKKFVEACPVLLITGQKSVFNGTTRALHQSILKTCCDKGKVEFIEVAGVANILEEKPDKLAESLQYFLQGLGLVSSLPMHNMSRTVPPPLRVRSMSMVEYDLPACQRHNIAEEQGWANYGPYLTGKLFYAARETLFADKRNIRSHIPSHGKSSFRRIQQQQQHRQQQQ